MNEHPIPKGALVDSITLTAENISELTEVMLDMPYEVLERVREHLLWVRHDLSRAIEVINNEQG